MAEFPPALTHKAIAVAESGLPRSSSACIRKDFTRHQLFAALALSHFFKTGYRGIVAILADSSDRRAALGLDKVPHFSTLA